MEDDDPARDPMISRWLRLGLPWMMILGLAAGLLALHNLPWQELMPLAVITYIQVFRLAFAGIMMTLED